MDVGRQLAVNAALLLLLFGAPAGASQQTGPDPAADDIRFDVWEIRVEGNEVLDRQQIERAVYPYVGPGKRVADMEAARANLERLYRDRGYGTVLVNLPEQNVDAGIVRLAVVGGEVDRLIVSDSRYFSLAQVREEMDALAPGTVPYLPRVQEQLSRANRMTPDRRVTPVLRPGRKVGTLEAELKVNDRFPLHGSSTLDNNYSADTEELRLRGSLSYDNLWQKYHSLSLQYQTAPQDPGQVQVLVGTYLLPFGPDKSNRLAVYAVQSESDTPSSSPFADAVIGDGTIFGARAIFPLKAFGSYYHNLSLGIDYKDFEEDIVAGSDTLNTPIDYTTFGASYSATLLKERRTTQFGLGFNFALRGLGNKGQEFEDKRFKSTPNFFYLTGNVRHEQALPRNWRGVVAGEFQATASPLISNEQFSAGGADSVRGYLTSQELGDSGLYAGLELHTPALAGYTDGWLNEAYGLGFFDFARLWVRDPLPGESSSATLTATGLGLRLASRRWSGEALWALALKDALDSSEPVEAGDSRVHFRLGYEF